LATFLRKRIVSLELGPGDSLPSEEALADEYGVSRITVRHALSILAEEGLLTRQRGKGTFVSERARIVDSPRSSGFIEDIIAMGHKTRVKILHLGMVQAHGTVQERLGLNPPARVLRIEKVRLLDGNPFSYVVNHLPEKIGLRIQSMDLTERPLLSILEEDLRIRAWEAVQTIEATVAEPDVAAHLEIRTGDPLLRVERTVFDTKGKPMEHVWVLYRADKYHFTVRLRRKKSRTSYGWEQA
jgi:GntR family transcriptional regulator